MRSNPRPVIAAPLECGISSELIRSVRDGAARDLFLAEGLRNLVCAVDNGWPFAGLAICPKRISGDLAHTLVRRVQRAQVPVLSLPADEFDSLALHVDAQGVLAVHPRQCSTLRDTEVRKNDLWIGVERVRSPGNLGTLIRCAHAAGATRVLVFSPRIGDVADPFCAGSVRAAMGSTFGLQYTYLTHRELRRWRHRNEITVLGAEGSAPTDYRAVTYRRPTLLMLGDERHGLSKEQRDSCDGFVRIPMSAGPDSLNIAMAGTVLLFEARSQRHPLKR